MLCDSHHIFSAFAAFGQIGDCSSRKVSRNRSPRLTSRPIALLHTEVRVNRFRLSLLVFSVACLLPVNLKSGAVDNRPLGSDAYSISGIQARHKRLALSSELLAKANSPHELTKLGRQQARFFFTWPQSSQVQSAVPLPRSESIVATTQRSSIRKVNKTPANGLLKCLKRFRRLCRGIPPRDTHPARKSRLTISTILSKTPNASETA